MGNRITRAATHLPVNAVQKRMQGEHHPGRRQRWEISYQALTTPRKAEDIARTVGVSPSTVHRVIAAYNQTGGAAIDTPGKGGRRHHYLTLEQERAFLKPFLARTARGEMATAVEIKLALEARIGHEVNKSTLYRLLDRHGWRQIGAEASPAQVKADKSVDGDLVAVREESRSAQGDAVAVWEGREQQAPLNAHRKWSAQRSPSDLPDQEWAIVEPLIPPAKPGGRPRSVDMREVLHAMFYVDRTGCQWRALPHDFPPWSTVWTSFRTWRTDGTWERIHTALREQVRVKQGREPTPSAAMIDSQSVKTSQKGGLAATTEARRSKAASAISWWIPTA